MTGRDEENGDNEHSESPARDYPLLRMHARTQAATTTLSQYPRLPSPPHLARRGRRTNRTVMVGHPHARVVSVVLLD